jgi:hypothetical protein
MVRNEPCEFEMELRARKSVKEEMRLDETRKYPEQEAKIDASR